LRKAIGSAIKSNEAAAKGGKAAYDRMQSEVKNQMLRGKNPSKRDQQPKNGKRKRRRGVSWFN